MISIHNARPLTLYWSFGGDLSSFLMKSDSLKMLKIFYFCLIRKQIEECQPILKSIKVKVVPRCIGSRCQSENTANVQGRCRNYCQCQAMSKSKGKGFLIHCRTQYSVRYGKDWLLVALAHVTFNLYLSFDRRSNHALKRCIIV